MFASNEFYPFIKELAFGTSDFLGALGGLLGLFAGMSVISAVEMVFHFLRLLVGKMADRRLLKVHAIKVRNTANSDNRSCIHRTLRYFSRIALKSDIHGIHFLVEGGRKFWEKVLWTLVVLCSTVFCSMQIYNVVRYSEVNPVEFGIDEKIWTINDASEMFSKIFSL